MPFFLTLTTNKTLPMKLELVQQAYRDGDASYNLKRTLDAIETCASNIDIVIFPEALLN